MTELSIVIPLYNEEGVLLSTVETLAPKFDDLIGKGHWHFVLVDNGSTDRTPAILAEIRSRWPETVVILEPTPNYGRALRAGISGSTAPWVHLIDIEQWDIPFLRWSWTHRNDYDLFLASKRADPTLNNQSEVRRLLSWGLNALLQLWSDFSGSDTHGPKLFRRSALQRILDACVMDRGQYDTEIVLRALRAGLRIIEIPVPYSETRPARMPIFKKVIWNLIAINRLRRIIGPVEYVGPVRFYRTSREDVLAQVHHIPVDTSRHDSQAGPCGAETPLA